MSLGLVQWLTPAVFAVTIAAIVVNKLDATVAALLPARRALYVALRIAEKEEVRKVSLHESYRGLWRSA